MGVLTCFYLWTSVYFVKNGSTQIQYKKIAKRETPSVVVVMVGVVVGWGWFGGGVGVVCWWFGGDVRVVRGGVGVVWGGVRLVWEWCWGGVGVV